MRRFARLAAMDAAEIAWRIRAALRTAADRSRAAFRTPRWNRYDLRRALAPIEDLSRVRSAVAAGRWDDAHRLLSSRFATAPRGFVIAWSLRPTLSETIRSVFPASAADAAASADRILAGEYDLLGYTGLRFDRRAPITDQPRTTSNERPTTNDQRGPTNDERPTTSLPDWHFDPAHGCLAPRLFWANVPYLEPSCGDHKIIWELNRHQHWLTLGRAYWLTGDSKYRTRALDELASWMDTNAPLTGINWASMLELAFRSLSWLWALHFFVEPDAHDRTPWTVDLLLGLDRQLRHVEHNLSYYFSPNTHLLGEALALYVTGRALPELAASHRRAALGRRVLVEQIERQIAADGGHCERSAHYHRYTLDFYLLALAVARITGDAAAIDFERAVARLAFAARLLADDNGRLPHIGDDDGGMLLPIAGRSPDDVRDSLAIAAELVNRSDLRIGPPPEEAFWMNAGSSVQGSDLPSKIPSAALRDSGYYVSRSAAGDHVVIDGGPHGYLNGGHAHADALSMTLTVRGRPLLIDPGTACYTVDAAMRNRLRSSALHNTLMLDGRSQSVPAETFHWSRTADSRVHRWRTNENFDFFDGSHDGYAPIEHRRRIFVLHSDVVVIADFVNGAGRHTAAVHWHVDPDWTVHVSGRCAVFTPAKATGSDVRLFATDGAMDRFVADEDTGLGWCSPVYGRLQHATTLRIAHEASAPFWIASVIDIGGRNPVEHVEWLPVWAEAGTVAHASALRLTRAFGVDYVLFAEATPRAQAAAAAAREPVTRRIAEFETDALMMFCRVDVDRRLTRVALVDGSMVRDAGRRGLHLTLPRVVPDLHLDLTADPRIAGPGFGARVTIGGRECAPELERRSAARS